jgi:hypothetical protein
MSNDDIQRTLGRIEANQETLTNEINMLRTDVAEIKTNCGAMKCKVNPVVGAGVAGGGVVGLVAAALMAWLQSKGYIP